MACCILGFGYFGKIKYSTVYVNVVFIDIDTVTNPTFCPLCNPGSARWRCWCSAVAERSTRSLSPSLHLNSQTISLWMFDLPSPGPERSQQYLWRIKWARIFVCATSYQWYFNGSSRIFHIGATAPMGCTNLLVCQFSPKIVWTWKNWAEKEGCASDASLISTTTFTIEALTVLKWFQEANRLKLFLTRTKLCQLHQATLRFHFQSFKIGNYHLETIQKRVHICHKNIVSVVEFSLKHYWSDIRGIFCIDS